MKKIILLLAVLLLLAGCTSRIGNFTIMTTKNVDWSDSINLARGNKSVKAVDKKYIIVLIPTGTPNITRALNKAMDSIPNCVALVDGVIDQTTWYIPYIYGETYYTIEGIPVIDKTLGSKE